MLKDEKLSDILRGIVRKLNMDILFLVGVL